MKTVKDRFRPLDQMETPDVWARAKLLEPDLGPDAEPPSGPRSGRLLAAVVALAVFLAAGVFAWRSLQPNPVNPSVGGGATSAATLWPERTAEEVTATQAQVDAGNRDLSWRLDPEQVATAFAEAVLGWGPPTSDTGGIYYDVTLDPTWTQGDDTAIVTLAHLPLPCPSPPPGEAMTCPPPYAGEQLLLQRSETTDGTGVWTVTEARASGFDLQLRAGDLLDNGDTVSGQVTFPSTAAVTTDYVAQYGFLVSGGGDCDSGSINGLQPKKDGDISFPASIGKEGWAAGGCASPASGFAFVASGSVQQCPTLGCPFVPLVENDLETNRKPLYGLTAIPISVSVLPSSAPELPPPPAPTASTGPPNSPSKVASPDVIPGNDLGALDCPPDEQSAVLISTELVPMSASETIPELVTRTFHGIAPGDEITTSGSEAGTNVAISRAGATIARAFLMPHLDRWVLSEFTSCVSSGIYPPPKNG